MNTMISNNQLAERFEIACGKSVAFLEYKVIGRLMTLVHTEVPEELGGKGFAGKLVKFALDHAKRNKLKVVAHCEFAHSYILRHKEYSSLLQQDQGK
ncbi:MAG: GNAT family N-acetyltransferase [Desulfuromonadales bacterium]